MRSLKITNTFTRRDQKSIEKYLTEISRYDVLSPEAELELFKKYKSGDEIAFRSIIRHNLRFVVSVAKQYQHVGFWLGDLINEGNIGLIKAAKRFDETKGFKFISYAVWWIRQSILSAINDKGRNIKIPQNLTSDTAKVMDSFRSILQSEEREPSNSELALATGFSEAHIERCLTAYQRCKSIDAPVLQGEYTPLVRLMEDKAIPAPDFKLVELESNEIEIQALLNRLPEKQAMVISLYFGIGLEDPKTLGDIGDRLGISRERARQIKDRGLRRLRRIYKSEQLLSA